MPTWSPSTGRFEMSVQTRTGSSRSLTPEPLWSHGGWSTTIVALTGHSAKCHPPNPPADSGLALNRRVNQMPKTHIGTGIENGDRSKTDFTNLPVVAFEGWQVKMLRGSEIYAFRGGPTAGPADATRDCSFSPLWKSFRQQFTNKLISFITPMEIITPIKFA